jgi:hypothetical protein
VGMSTPVKAADTAHSLVPREGSRDRPGCCHTQTHGEISKGWGGEWGVREGLRGVGVSTYVEACEGSVGADVGPTHSLQLPTTTHKHLHTSTLAQHRERDEKSVRAWGRGGLMAEGRRGVM